MHIPDSYLGLYTIAATWLVMIPIWVYAGRKLSNELKSRQVPLLALSAAFSFVIMMFNVPAPGGGVGHAVGGGLVGIIMGPWAAVISISVALILQALMFGDGGVWALAANCLNMAVIMPFSAYLIYRLASGSSQIMSSRRIFAAALAGYVSLTLAAASTAIMFGIQPILHQSEEGLPMYMPFGLNVTLPVMLGEHMLFLSFLEAIVTGLVFAYIQKTDSTILDRAASKKREKAQRA